MKRRQFFQKSAKVSAAAIALPTGAASILGSLSGCVTSGAWQIGCYTRPWDKHDYLVALDAIAEAGYKYVGLMTTKSPSRLVISKDTTVAEAAKAGEEAKKRNLQIVSVYGGGFGIETSLMAGVDSLKRLIDNCQACNGGNLLLVGTGDETLFEDYYTAVAECCDYAAERGIGISVKPHGGLNATGPQCRRIVESINHPAFRIWYDAGNIFYYSDGALDPITDAGTVDGLVIGMSVKDYQNPKNVLLTPGTGLVNFQVVFDRLQQGGFTAGPLVVECLRTGSLEETLKEAIMARQFLLELTGQS